MVFRNTPQLLKANNVTSLDPSKIGEYVAMAQESYSEAEEERRRLPFLARQKYFIAAGCSVMQRPPRNSFNELDEILERREQTSDDLHALLQTFKRKAHFTIKRPNRGSIDKRGFSIKADSRIKEKAMEYASKDLDDRPFSRVADTVRTTLLMKSASDIQKFGELIRPCKISGVIRFHNSFFQPNISPIRRLMINYRGPSGVCSEIQVRHSIAEPFYDASENHKHREREANSAIARGSTRSGGDEAVRRAGKTSKKASISRATSNAQANSVKEVSILQGSFEHYAVDGFPIIINNDNWENTHFALVPDPKSGLWATDNRFQDLIRGDHVKQITPKEAELMGEALAQSSEVRRSLEVG